MKNPKKKKILIIGGGITGMTAALRLSQAGFSVTLAEKNETLGGLASGFKFEDTHLEKAYHHLFKTDVDILNLCEELDIYDKIQWHKSSMSTFVDSEIYPFNGPIDLLKFSPLNFFNRIRTGFVLLFLKYFSNWRKLSNITAFNWLKKWNGNEAMLKLWLPLLKGKFHKYYDKVSMAWFWARIHTRANSREKTEKLGYPIGGFNTVVEGLEKELLAKNVQILSNSSQNLLNLTQKLINKSGEYDSILFTTPNNVLAHVLEKIGGYDNYVNQLMSINYIGAICMIFSTEQDLTQSYWNNINEENSPLLVFINHTQLIKKSVYNGKNVYYIAGYYEHKHEYFEFDEEKLREEWFSHLQKLLPKFDKSKTENVNIFKFKNAQHIVDTDYLNKIPSCRTPIKGLYLSNFTQIYPEDRGTNFAVREGNKVAEMIIADMSKETGVSN